MKRSLLIAAASLLGFLSSGGLAAGADSGRMLAAPTPMFTEWQARFGAAPPDFDALRTCAGLPPLLEFYDGRPVQTADQWQQRRAELRRLLCEYFLGSPPQAIPQRKQAKVLAENREGASISRLVELVFDTTPEVSITIEVLAPEGRGPFPVVFTQTNHRRWGLLALARGYLVCVYPGEGLRLTGELLARDHAVGVGVIRLEELCPVLSRRPAEVVTAFLLRSICEPDRQRAKQKRHDRDPDKRPVPAHPIHSSLVCVGLVVDRDVGVPRVIPAIAQNSL